MTEQRLAARTPVEHESTTGAALTATLSIAALAWVASVRQMRGMDMGPATDLGSFGEFVPLWTSMMAAMMLPGAAAPLMRRVAAHGLRTLPQFAVSYLAVWVAVGVMAYALYRPHGSVAAGALVIVAGLYEFTPLKRLFRQQCRSSISSGYRYGLACVGSSIGLMLVLLDVGVMSIIWMAVISVLVTAQKVLPRNAARDVSLAVAMVGFGVWILLAPSTVPGLLPSM